MRVVLNSETDLTLMALNEPEFDVVSEDPHAHYSALQMFATSMALCTYAVLAGYSEQIDVATDDISLRIRWSYVDEPFRIGEIDMSIRWPGLPASRREAAERAAGQCTLHNTLHHPPRITTALSVD